MSVSRETLRVLDAERLDAINDRLSGTHWKQVLATSDDAGIAARREAFENRRSGYFHLMLGGGAGGRVLDVGAGTGLVSSVLAGYCDSVVALDDDPAAVGFMRRRFEQDGQTNVDVVLADALCLPFGEASFDLVVVNGVLEWLPRADTARDPLQVQRDFLRRAGAVLRPGGRLTLAIENRFHFNFFLGRTPHGDVPLTPVLPRPLARAISRLARGKPYETYIHSATALRRMLNEAGFARVDVYVALPSYHNPVLIVPMSSRSVAREVFSTWGTLPARRIRRFVYLQLARAGLLKRLSHSLLVVGTKDA